MSQSSN